MLGFPIRTSSDHSSVDSSPRPIAASHVLHRLLMPRHPPCALKHLFTTRCSHPLCNTQHTTTPQPTTTTTTPTQTPQGAHHGDALDGHGPEAATRKNTHQPARCLLRTQQCAEPFTISGVMFHPATPPQQAKGCGNNKKETHDNMPGFAPPYGEAP